MPATTEELCGWVRGLLGGEIMPDTVPRSPSSGEMAAMVPSGLR